MTHAAYQMSGPKRLFLRVHQGRQEIQVHASVRNEIGALLSVMIKAFFDIPWGEKKELQFILNICKYVQRWLGPTCRRKEFIMGASYDPYL